MIAYSERQRQILRLARIFHSVPNPHNHLPHNFLFLLRLFIERVGIARWKEEEEEDLKSRRARAQRMCERFP
jgi:hypothetical protein